MKYKNIALIFHVQAVIPHSIWSVNSGGNTGYTSEKCFQWRGRRQTVAD